MECMWLKSYSPSPCQLTGGRMPLKVYVEIDRAIYIPSSQKADIECI